MRRKKLLRYLWQLPVIVLWRLGILIALKAYYRGFVICDITSTQSNYGEHFKADVRAVLDDLNKKSPKMVQQLQLHVRYIARAEICERFEYYTLPRLLLLNLDYEVRSNLRFSVERNFVDFLDLAEPIS